jgi:chromosome segregation protein
MRHEKQQAQEKIAFQEGQLEKEEASFLELFQESQKAREKEIETSQALKFLQTQHEDESRLKTGFKDQIEKLELKQQNLTSQFEHGKEQLKHLQQSYDKIEDSLKVCEENLEKARHEQNESFKQKQQLEARQLEKKHQKQLLEQKLQGLRNQKQQLSRQCQGTIQSIERLTQELLQHQNEYKNLEAKVSQLRSEQIQESLLEQLRQEQTAEQESLEASRKNLLELEAQVHQRNAHLKWLEERLRSSSGKALGQWMGTCTDLEKQTKLIPLNEILAKEIPKDELGFWKHLESVYLVDQAYIEVIEKGLEPDQAPSFALWPIERQAQETFEQACRRQIKYALTLHLEKNKGKVWKTWAGRLVRVDEMGILWSMEKSASSAQMLQELPREKALLQEQKIQQQELVQLVASSQQQVEAIKKSLASLEKQSVAQALNLQKEQSRLESLGHRLEFLKEQKNAQEQARETLVKSLEPIEISLQEGEKELLVVGGYKEEALMPIQHLIQESQSHFHRLKSQKETLEHEKNHILTQKARFQAQIQSAEGLLKEGQESLRENQASYEAYVLKEKTTLVRLEQGREQQAQFVSQSQKLSFELEEKQKRSVALKQQIKELLRQIKAVEAKSEQCQQKAFHEGKKLDEVQWGKRALEESIDLQEAQLWDGVDVNPKDLEHQIAGHKARQQELGFVNFAAAKELGDMQERHSLIQTQMEDVQAAKVELMRVIAYLDEKCHLQFSETYERVKEAFKRNFIQIFEGGTADLIQKGDEENQGVDIQAFPPGKQVKSLVLMSGGEKCLTALAFMMALFEVRPAPFCLLDEIDAPLDDSNVEKLIRLLKHYSDRTQIFIITHNKKTMAAASTLLGVSMPKRGVSQLLVLDIETRQVQIGALTLASL